MNSVTMYTQDNKTYRIEYFDKTNYRSNLKQD